MNATPLKAVASSDRVEMHLKFFDTAKIFPSEPDPVTPTAFHLELLSDLRQRPQRLPGFVYPDPVLAEDERRCLEGHHRLWCCKQLNRPFLAFDLGRFVEEAEQIELIVGTNSLRRVMSRGELADKAARYMELKGCTAAEASKMLGVSAATLSRAFGEARIPAELKPRAQQLGQSIRSIIAAAPAAVMAKAIDYAQTPDPASGKLPTRDAVDLHIRQLKKDGGSKEPKPKAIRLELEGRVITIDVNEGDVASGTAKELKAIASKLAGLGDKKPEAWPHFFD